MYLKHKPSSDLVEVMDVQALIDPYRDTVQARFHSGEELQDPSEFNKSDLLFPSNEPLPRCWIDPNYQAG